MISRNSGNGSVRSPCDYCLFLFYKELCDNVKIRRALNILLAIFVVSILAYYLYYLIGHGSIDRYFLLNAYTIQASFLIALCILYYIDLFAKEPKISLLAQPSFWGASGLAFFMLGTLPFSLFGSYLVTANHQLYSYLFSIFDVFYCLLFLMIMKAYLCKPVIA